MTRYFKLNNGYLGLNKGLMDPEDPNDISGWSNFYKESGAFVASVERFHDFDAQVQWALGRGWKEVSEEDFNKLPANGTQEGVSSIAGLAAAMGDK